MKCTGFYVKCVSYGSGEKSETRIFVITENYAGPNTDGFYSFIGARLMIGRASLEAGFLPPREYGDKGIPLVGISIPLHGKAKE